MLPDQVRKPKLRKSLPRAKKILSLADDICIICNLKVIKPTIITSILTSAPALPLHLQLVHGGGESAGMELALCSTPGERVGGSC